MHLYTISPSIQVENPLTGSGQDLLPALNIPQAQTDYWSVKQSSWAPLFSWAVSAIFVLGVFGSIVAIRKRCPNCGQMTLRRTHRVVKKTQQLRMNSQQAERYNRLQIYSLEVVKKLFHDLNLTFIIAPTVTLTSPESLR
ncbi:zinc ribbon protein, nin one binding (NOB1) type [Leptolyngbya sp. PCC 7375]|nr:zinc ribbon protein, nin one binding (NOB1) type [Leptolyngbya sp. PCC 7375]